MHKCHVYRDKNWIIEFKINWRKSIKEDNVLVGHAVDLAVLMGWTSCQTVYKFTVCTPWRAC